jgi:hypothetical protein
MWAFNGGDASLADEPAAGALPQGAPCRKRRQWAIWLVFGPIGTRTASVMRVFQANVIDGF